MNWATEYTYRCLRNEKTHVTAYAYYKVSYYANDAIKDLKLYAQLTGKD